MRTRIATTLFALPAVAALTPIAGAQTPFPTEKNQRLEELDTHFIVQGRMHLPRRLSIDGLRAMTIQGEGEDATLELSGKLKLRAATGGRIELVDVWLEVKPDCKELALANCSFRGKGGIRPSPDGPSNAKIHLEQVSSESGVPITIDGAGGSMLMDRCYLDGPLVVRGVPKSAKAKSTLTASIFGSYGRTRDRRARGLLGGVRVEGLRDGTIRTCDIGGPEAVFTDNKKLYFDGNNVRAERVEFAITEDGKFSGLKITKNDFRTPKLVLAAPVQGNKAARLTLDKCYFRGMESLETMRAEMLEDFENSESGVVAVLRDVCTEPNNFAGSEN